MDKKESYMKIDLSIMLFVVLVTGAIAIINI